MNGLQKAAAMLRLVRPELPLSAGVCVVIGQVIGLGAIPPQRLLLLGFALGLLLSASQMVFNDYFDLEVDRVNAPERPIPAGQVAPGEAVGLGGILAAAALVISTFLHPLAFWLSLAAWILGFLYNWRLKSAGLAGNLIVAANVGLTFLIGGVSVEQAANPLVWVFAAIAFTFDLAEEISGDAMDMEGDRARASRSLAIVHGRAAALRISAALFGLVILLTLVPLWLGETGPGYWVPIAVMDGLIVFFASRLGKSRTREEGHRWMRRLYLSATLGLLAFVVGRFVG